METVEADNQIYNQMCFTKSIVNKLFTIIPPEVNLFWKPVLEHPEFPIGGARWDNGIFNSLYIRVDTQQIKSCMLKFLYVDGEFIFDSIYANYDVEKQKNISPYENRYNSKFDILAVYKRELIQIEGKNYVQILQNKNNKKTKEYYVARENTPITVLQDLINMDAIRYNKLNQNINMYQLRVKEFPNIVYYYIN
jgi:hypothetical protein